MLVEEISPHNTSGLFYLNGLEALVPEVRMAAWGYLKS
jgi:hypothetical protein